MTKKIWNRYKALPWYWKILLGIFFLLAIAIAYLVFSRRDVEVTNEEIVQHSKRKTDDVVRQFEDEEEARVADRLALQNRRISIQKETKETYETHENIMDDIDSADSADELLDIAEILRKRNRQ